MSLPIIKCLDCKGLFTAEKGLTNICPWCGEKFRILKEDDKQVIVRA